MNIHTVGAFQFQMATIASKNATLVDIGVVLFEMSLLAKGFFAFFALELFFHDLSIECDLYFLRFGRQWFGYEFT